MMTWLLLLLSLLASPAQAQGCGPSNPNCTVPTLPPGTCDTRAASTAFVCSSGGGGGGGGLSITRAQIPGVSLAGVASLSLTGFSAANDAGLGAPYTCVGQSSSSPLAIQDLGGNWCALAALQSNSPVMIGWFGADPTGTNDSAPAIQSALDYAQTNKPKRDVVCADGTYKVGLSIFMDPPGFLRGPDGVNGHNWSSGDTFQIGGMANFGGVSYTSLQNSNSNHQPNLTLGVWWRLSQWQSGTTYASGDLVRFKNVVWKSTQNGNLNNTPDFGTSPVDPLYGDVGPPGLPWQIWFNNDTTPHNSVTFRGSGGHISAGNNQGCTLNYTFSNGYGVVIGAVDGNLLSDMTLHGGYGGYRTFQPNNGIGVAIAGGGDGASRTIIRNVEMDNWQQGSLTGFNGDQQGEENTWDHVSMDNCVVGIAIAQSQNFINSVYDSGIGCLNTFIATAGPGIHVFGGDYAPISTQKNIFTMASTSITGSLSGPNVTWLFTVTTTLGGGIEFGGAGNPPGLLGTAGQCALISGHWYDCNINSCAVTNPTAIGNCTYNKWMMRLPGWGMVPMSMTAYNYTTHAATFTIDANWALLVGNWNLMDGCSAGPTFTAPPTTTCTNDFAAEVIANTTVYAVEHAVIFQGANFSARGMHLEPSAGACIQFLNSVAGPTARGHLFTDILFQYAIGGSDFRNNNSATDPSFGIFACQEATPFMDASGNSAPGWTFQQSAFNGGQGGDPVIIISPETGLPNQCDFQNQGNGLQSVVQISRNGEGCWWKQPPLQINSQSATNFDATMAIFTGGMQGWLPTPFGIPRIQQSHFNNMRNITTGTFNNYPYIYGNMTYQILDYDSPLAQLVQSDHVSASFGQNLTQAFYTASGVGTLSWSYKAGTNVVNMDAASLSYVFPGLVIGLNNGSGNQYYYVYAVFAHDSLDGCPQPGNACPAGTHPGYVLVAKVPNGISRQYNGEILVAVTPGGVLAGTAGPSPTTYTTTGSPHGEVAVINQQPFSFNNVSVLSTLTGNWFSNDNPPANINRMADRTLMGDAINKSGNSSCAGTDWFTVFQGNTSNGVCGYGHPALQVEGSATNAGGPSAILGAGQTKNQNTGGAFGIEGFALNNNASAGGGGGGTGAWAGYFECDYIIHNPNGVPCFGQEIEVANFISDADAGQPDPFNQGPINTQQLGCGSGIQYLGVGSHKCSAALQVVNASALGSTTGFIVGLNWLTNSVGAQTLFGGSVSVAGALPPRYAFVWYSAHNVPQGGLEFDSGGNLQLGLNGTIIMTNSAGTGLGTGVSCASGTVNAATVVTVNGIVTHC